MHQEHPVHLIVLKLFGYDILTNKNHILNFRIVSKNKKDANASQFGCQQAM